MTPIEECVRQLQQGYDESFNFDFDPEDSPSWRLRLYDEIVLESDDSGAFLHALKIFMAGMRLGRQLHIDDLDPRE